VEWGMDFQDVSSVPAGPEGKQQYPVDIRNFVDHCSSGTLEPQTQKPYKNKSFLQILAITGLGLITRRSQVQVLPPLYKKRY
jgi:hypothetical protein